MLTGLCMWNVRVFAGLRRLGQTHSLETCGCVQCMHYMHETDQIELMLHAHYAALHVICVRTPQVCDTDINTMDAHGVNHIVIKLA